MPPVAIDLKVEMEKAKQREPLLHSHVEDELPAHHPLAFQFVYCLSCREMVHAGNNECMRTWVETGKGPYCIECLADLTDGCLEEEDGWGLTESAADPAETDSPPRT
jgi:hypothetical protein